MIFKATCRQSIHCTMIPNYRLRNPEIDNIKTFNNLNKYSSLDINDIDRAFYKNSLSRDKEFIEYMMTSDYAFSTNIVIVCMALLLMFLIKLTQMTAHQRT